MQRSIESFRLDDAHDWIADLSCHHSQHVRHTPPWQDRPWVETADGRASRLGMPLDCPLCDRAELPAGLQVARTAGPFNATSLPDALQRDHRIAERTWGCLRVAEGEVLFSMDGDPPLHRRLRAGDVQPIPPGVVHSLSVVGPVVLRIEFLVAGG